MCFKRFVAKKDWITYTKAAQCSDPTTASGKSDLRVRYQSASVNAPATCQAEAQERTCTNGNWDAWSGTFSHDTCAVVQAFSKLLFVVEIPIPYAMNESVLLLPSFIYLPSFTLPYRPSLLPFISSSLFSGLMSRLA